MLNQTYSRNRHRHMHRHRRRVKTTRKGDGRRKWRGRCLGRGHRLAQPDGLQRAAHAQRPQEQTETPSSERRRDGERDGKREGGREDGDSRRDLEW